MAKAFLDTNIFFYAVDARDPIKQERARALISEMAISGDGVVSTQVIHEFANNAIKQLGFTQEQTITLCQAFADHKVVAADLDRICDALTLMRSYSLSFWDACIASAAEHGQCKTLYTEDLNSGQPINGIRIVNPFA